MQQVGGFAPEEEWRWVQCDGQGIWKPLAPRNGATPFRAEILVSLTIAEAERIPTDTGTTLADIWPHLVGRVRAWNVRAANVVTGEWEDVPPPIEGGVESLRAAHSMITEWLAWMLKYPGLRDASLPKDATPPDDGPGPTSDSGSSSPTPPSTSPPNLPA